MNTAFFVRITLSYILLGAAFGTCAQTTEIFVNGAPTVPTPYGVRIGRTDKIEIVVTADKDSYICIKGLQMSTAKPDKRRPQNQMQQEESESQRRQIQKTIKSKLWDGKLHFVFSSEMLTKATGQNMSAVLLTDKPCEQKLRSLNKYYLFYIAE